MSYDDRPGSPAYRRRRIERRLIVGATIAVLVPVAVLLWLAFTA